ncbi:MAG: hypothetical protein ACTS5I_03625 [Rhodanobacter sp.]
MLIPETLPCIRAAVSGLALIDLALLQANPGMKPLYESGVRYVREGPGHEKWQPITQLYARKMGDCEDLAAARCAELRLKGEDATIHVALIRPGLIHIRVRRGDGSIEDPSKRLGM